MSRRVSFGFDMVDDTVQRRGIRRIFSSVAPSYDLMNDLMSVGLHRLWKRFAVTVAGPRPGEYVLDVAGGTGDIARLCRSRMGNDGTVVLLDANAEMIEQGRRRGWNDGVTNGIDYLRADAESAPLRPRSFDCVIVAFGLRNFTDREGALSRLRAVLKRGGRLVVLEFSQPIWPVLRTSCQTYCLNVLPRLGEWVAGDGDSYRYLGESMAVFPDQWQVTAMMRRAGLSEVRHYNLAGGIAALHQGFRL